MDRFDFRSRFARDQPPFKRDDLAREPLAFGEGRLSDAEKLIALEAIEFQCPRFAIDQQQLARADLGVEIELLRERSPGERISTAKSGPLYQNVSQSTALLP